MGKIVASDENVLRKGQILALGGRHPNDDALGGQVSGRMAVSLWLLRGQCLSLAANIEGS